MSARFSNVNNPNNNLSNNTHKKIFVIVTISLILVLIIILFFSFGNRSIIGSIFSPASTGKAVLSLDTDYIANETLNGNLRVEMKAGELIPADSIFRIDMAGEIYDYKLSELISNEQVNGSFYAEGKSLSGSGAGYGIAGIGKGYPDVNFVMKVTSSSEKDKDKETGQDKKTEQPTDTTEETQTPTSNITEGESTETTSTETTTTGSAPTEQPAQTETTTTETTEPQTETPTETSTAETTTTESTSPVTGSVSVAFEKEVTGIVSKNSPYTYNLEKGESAEIVSSEHEVSLDVKDNIVTITTNYYEENGRGFGESYLSDNAEYEFVIELSLLNLTARDGDITLSFIYGELEIASVSTELNVVDIGNLTDTNLTETNITTNFTAQNLRDYALTEEEILLLKSKTGASEVKITKSEIINNRLVVKFEIGNYWMQASYNPGEPELDFQIELDKARWIKKLAQKLAEKESSTEQIDKYIGSYNLTS